MTEKQELKAKSLELAILIRGGLPAVMTGNEEKALTPYIPLAKAIEKFINS